MTKANRNATHTYQKTDKGDFEIGTMRSFNNVATLREVSLTQKFHNESYFLVCPLLCGHKGSRLLNFFAIPKF